MHIIKLQYHFGKGKVHSTTDLEVPEGEQSYNFTLPLTLTPDKSWAVNDTPRPLHSRKRNLAPILQEAGFWTGAENLVPIGIRSPDLPIRSLLVIPPHCVKSL
jgi:hypothetical protein